MEAVWALLWAWHVGWEWDTKMWWPEPSLRAGSAHSSVVFSAPSHGVCDLGWWAVKETVIGVPRQGEGPLGPPPEQMAGAQSSGWQKTLVPTPTILGLTFLGAHLKGTRCLPLPSDVCAHLSLL